MKIHGNEAIGSKKKTSWSARSGKIVYGILRHIIKYSYFFRVVSYIKNGWENNFIDKYKHLGADIPDTTAVAANIEKYARIPTSSKLAAYHQC